MVGVAAALSLSGCSLLATGPARDASGSVTEATQIGAPDLRVGDCFSYVGDGTDLTAVTVSPCASDHAFVVVDQGSLSQKQIDEAGSLQVAVSVACTEKFEVFTAALSKGLHSELSFLVSTDKVDGKTTNKYSCVAVDPTLDPATEAIEPAATE